MKLKTVLILLIFTYSLSAQTGADYCSEAKIKSAFILDKSGTVQYPGDQTINVTYYKLNLTVTTNPDRLDGIVTVKARPVADGLTNFYLDLKYDMTVTSVKSGNSNLSYTQTTDNKLSITLNRAYGTNEEFSVDIAYGGVPSAGTGAISSASFSFYDQSFGKRVVASLSEPYGARDWWPSKDTPADKADSSDVWITADKFFISVSNGSLESVTDNQDGTRTYKWKNHYPIANYLISIAMTNYQIINDQFEYSPGKFLPVVHYSYPEKSNSTRTAAVAKTIGMLQIFSDKFGPYPYLKEKYGHAEFAWGGGMEHQTITSMGGGAMNSENVIAHELSHQWFGDKVTCKDWQNIWLNEGFASYSECVYREAKYGNADFKTYVNAFMNQARTANGSIYVQNINSENEIFNSARSYKKGAIVLHMLRGITGDDKFFRILKEYLAEPGLSYSSATTEDFERITERVTGQDLRYFFNEWIYGENFPAYSIEWSYKADVNGTYLISISIVQSVNSNPRYFTMPLQFLITSANGTLLKTVYNNAQSQTFQIRVGSKPVSIQFDPDNWVLKNVTGVKYLGNDDLVPNKFYLDQNYPNPFNGSTNIRYEIAQAGHVSLKIFDELGNSVAEIVNENKSKGKYGTSFDPTKYKLSSGIYYYKLISGNYADTKKMILIK